MSIVAGAGNGVGGDGRFNRGKFFGCECDVEGG